MNTPNRGIPYVPEGTLDPAAGLNLSLNVVDALLQCAVLTMNLTAPPGSPADGDLHLVAALGGTATGAWATKENYLARYVADGAFWQFYTPGVHVFVVLNRADGGLYAWQDDSPGVWLTAFPGASGAPIVVMPSAAYTLGDLTPGAWHTFTNNGGVTLVIDEDAVEPIETAAEYGIYVTGTNGLTVLPVSGVNVTPPKLGSLEMETGDFAMLKRLAADTYKLAGEVVLA